MPSATGIFDAAKLRSVAMMRLTCAAIAVLSFLPVAAAAAERPCLEPGPIRVRDQFLLGVGFLSFDPVSAVPLPSGEWEVEAVWTVANTWANSGAVELALEARDGRVPVTTEFLEDLADRRFDGTLVYADGEVSKLALGVSRGLAGGVELGLTVPVLHFGGGVLDGPIEAFHDTFGLGQAGREGANKDEFLAFVRTPRGELWATESPGTVLGDLVLSSKVRIPTRASRWRLALEGSLKLPTADDEPLVTSGEIDGGLQLLWSRQSRLWSVHGSTGVLFLGASEGLGIDSQSRWAGLIAVERAIGWRSSLLLQVVLSESPFEQLDTSRIDADIFESTLGFKFATSEKSLLTLALSENFQNHTNSADLSLHVGLSRRFR